MSFDALRAEFIQRTRRGIAFIGAGVIVWTLFGILGIVLPEPIRPFIYLFGAGVQFPAGILLATLLKHDWQSKGSPFALLPGLVGGLQILFAPVVIMTWVKHPELLPGYLGVLVGAHFLPFVWLYKSRTYLFLSIGITLTAAATGLLLTASAYRLTPFSVAAILAVATLMLHSENTKNASQVQPTSAVH
jgi:hypothetical protein